MPGPTQVVEQGGESGVLEQGVFGKGRNHHLSVSVPENSVVSRLHTAQRKHACSLCPGELACPPKNGRLRKPQTSCCPIQTFISFKKTYEISSEKTLSF